MRLGKCDTKTKRLHTQTRANREARQEVAVISRHIGARAVVVTQCQIDVILGQYLDAEDQVTQQIAAEIFFLNQCTIGVVLVLWGEVG